MNVSIREYKEKDIEKILEIWNEVVADGIAFPEMDELSKPEATEFFGGQSFVGVAENEGTGEIQGLYVLHPNNVGRCGHISNSSYAVKSTARGLCIGEKLVIHSLGKAKDLGFRILQFNAVVKTNASAIRIYDKPIFPMYN